MMKIGFNPNRQNFNQKNNGKQQAFSGKLNVTTNGMEHAITAKVIEAVKKAPEHITLHVSELIPNPVTTRNHFIYPNVGNIGFSSPVTGNSPVTLVTGDKNKMTEKHMLDALKTSIETDKKGELPPNSFLRI